MMNFKKVKQRETPVFIRIDRFQNVVYLLCDVNAVGVQSQKIQVFSVSDFVKLSNESDSYDSIHAIFFL